MTLNEQIAAHYRHGDLLQAIEDGLSNLGLGPNRVTVDDLGPVDEFHIGGRIASTHFLDQLAIDAGMNVLDVGCGLGGGARFTAAAYEAQVPGIDLTPEYVETGQVLCDWVGLSDRVSLRQGSALSMPFPDREFQRAYMMHVGMNIDAKEALFAEVHRVLDSGARFGIYDIMRTGEGDLAYPVPWAGSRDTSWLTGPEGYRKALEAAGFECLTENNRGAFALDFFRKIREANATRGGPPPLGLHTLMQHSTAEKVGNMEANIAAGLIAPVEMIAVKG